MQNHGDAAAAAGLMAAIGIFFVVLMIVALAIHALICYLVYTCYQRIPEAHRKLQPGLVWLNMIPCVAFVWNFWVFPRLSQSFKSYFDSAGKTDVGDCGAQLALWYPIAAACCIVPIVNWIAGPASLVLLILYLVKATGLKNQIPPTA